MQGIRPLNDENSMAHLHRPVLGNGKGGRAAEGVGLAAKTPGFQPSARKALGNITNRGSGLEQGPPGKTPAASTAPRRALGDITNAGSVAAGPLRPADKPAAPGPSSCAKPLPSTAHDRVASTSSRLDELAADGVERLAGRSWEQLEVDRDAMADAEISARLEALATLPRRSMPSFFPLWNASLTSLEQSGQLQRELVHSPPPSPVGAAPLPSLASLEAPELEAPIILPVLGGSMADMDLDMVLFDDGRSDTSGGSGGGACS